MPYLNKCWSRFFALSLLVVFCPVISKAQNYSVQNTYLSNPFAINPAAAGSEYTQLYTSYRAQWLGMPGAPKYIYGGFNTLLDKTRAGVGFKASSFSRGFLTTTDVSASFSYGVPVSKTSKLIMGLSGGVLMQSINWSQITDDTDPALAAQAKGTIPAISFGMLFKDASGFNFGVVMPQMIRSQTLNTNFQVVPDNLVVMAYYSNWHPQTGVKSHNRSRKHASNKKDGVPWELYGLYRHTKSGGQAEVFAKYNAKGVFGMLGYRQGFGLIPGVGFNLGKVNLQYTYESGLGGEVPLKSHEFLISAKLGEKKTFKGDAGKTKTNTAPPNPKPRFPSNSLDEPKLSKSNNKSSNKGTKNTTAVASNKNVENKNTTSGNTPRNRPQDTNLNNNPTEEKKTPVETKTEEKTQPVVTQTEEKKTPVETKTEEKKQPVVTQTEEKKTPVETKTEEKKQPVVTQTEEKKTPVETKTEEKKQPVVTQTEEKKTPVETKTEEKKTPVETKTEEKKQPVVTQTEEKKTPTETKTEEKKTTAPGEVVHLTEEEQSAHEEDVLSRLEEHSDNPTEEHAGEEHPHAERHEFWAKGNHEKELEIGHYVIVGVFKSEANAKRVSDGYRNLGFSEVDYGYQSGKGFWFVHIAGSEDMDVPEAGKLRNKYRKMKMFRDAWLLTVHQ